MLVSVQQSDRMAWAAYLVWMQSMGFPTYWRPNTMTLKVNSRATVAEQLRWNTDASILMLPTCSKKDATFVTPCVSADEVCGRAASE